MSTTPGTISNTPAPSHPANEVSNTRLYLGNLPRNVTRSDVESHFNKHGTGEILDIKLMNGFGFIEYRDAMDARDVVPAFHGSDFMGERLTVQFARGRRGEGGGPGGGPGGGLGGGPNHGPGGGGLGHGPYGGGGGGGPGGGGYNSHDRPPPRPRRTAHRMAITGLPNDTSWQDLKDFARRSGLEVVFSETNRFGDGSVEFESAQDLATAIEKLDNTEFRDKIVTCSVGVSLAVSDLSASASVCLLTMYSQVFTDMPPRDGRGRSRSPHPGRRPYGMPPRDDYDHRRGPPPPPRGYSPSRRGEAAYRESYRDRSPPPRREYFDDRMHYPTSPRRGPVEDYPPPSRRYDDPYRREYPPSDPYANNRAPYGRPPPPRDFPPRDVGYPREGGYSRDYDRRYW
ncbi:pre-RNA splicing factor [Grosmannia clavigera kw1407]|uniref:Pre-RNA splicing factor n=1 Tax=Grosmannia clavigera (strain kw1407 / UAMH 11150) TaxID=655863 RepID=F0XKF8_GROCL|nr:pre-RNA splicing factor [Grosmannia clavigera kw1407]EFX01771.1 pre-RNA splicing factor [Grosmannia clavigera kw1407]